MPVWLVIRPMRLPFTASKPLSRRVSMPELHGGDAVRAEEPSSRHTAERQQGQGEAAREQEDHVEPGYEPGRPQLKAENGNFFSRNSHLPLRLLPSSAFCFHGTFLTRPTAARRHPRPRTRPAHRRRAAARAAGRLHPLHPQHHQPARFAEAARRPARPQPASSRSSRLIRKAGRVSRLKAIGNEPPGATQLRGLDDAGARAAARRRSPRGCCAFSASTSTFARCWTCACAATKPWITPCADAATAWMSRRWCGWRGRSTRRCARAASRVAASIFPATRRPRSDAHHELPVIERTRAELDAMELAPYRALRRRTRQHHGLPRVLSLPRPARIDAARLALAQRHHGPAARRNSVTGGWS